MILEVFFMKRLGGYSESFCFVGEVVERNIKPYSERFSSSNRPRASVKYKVV
jgi:hypothetical protein